MKVRAYGCKSKKQKSSEKSPKHYLKNPTQTDLMTFVGGYASEIP